MIFFIDEPDYHIGERIIQHPNVSVQTLLKLAEKECSGVRRSLFDRGNSLPSVVLEKMTEVTLAQIQAKTDAQYRQDNEDTIISLISSHPNTPSHILEMFITNQTVELHQRLGENWCSNFLYRSVSNNINTPIHILEKLVSDPQFRNSGAREDARKNLRHRS